MSKDIFLIEQLLIILIAVLAPSFVIAGFILMVKDCLSNER